MRFLGPWHTAFIGALHLKLIGATLLVVTSISLTLLAMVRYSQARQPVAERPTHTLYGASGFPFSCSCPLDHDHVVTGVFGGHVG